MLTNKKIVLGVSGGIAAYKSIELVSRLRKKGADVKVIMTNSATKFVTPLTFREVSKNPVAVSMWEEIQEYDVEHIALAMWADIFLITPATANIIAKITHGIADDMLSTTLLATKAKVVVCPAMNTNMYENVVTQKNIVTLKERGYHIIPPVSGLLACGTSGVGRLPEPADIVIAVENIAKETELVFVGKKFLITAAGTREPIDPVRYIGNRSSGKMGYAIAKKAVAMGAEVVLVSGPSALPVPEGLKFIAVESAAEMMDAVLAEYSDTDYVIKAAAVADYRVKDVAVNKIKKEAGAIPTIILEKNPDILQELGARKTKQVLVGFAAETQYLIENAQSKIVKKNLDLIVANDVSLPGAGFNHDTNIVKIIFANGKILELAKMTKELIAEKLLTILLTMQKK